MPRFPALSIAASVAIVLALAAASPAVAQESGSGGSSGETAGDFDELVERGRTAYSEKNWMDAAEAFEKAYEVKQVPNLLYNIGRVYENAGEFKKAISFYEKFVNQPGIDIDNRKDALDRIETLEQIVDYSEREEEEAPESGSTVEPEQTAAPPGDGAPIGPGTQQSFNIAATLAGVGGAGLIAGSIFGILASDANSDFESADSLQGRRDAIDRGETFSTVADILWISGGAIAATGIGLVIWPIERQPATDGRARVQPLLGPGRAGLELDVHF